MNKTLPWWLQISLAVLAIAGTVAVEYFQERAADADSSEAGYGKQAGSKPKRKRVKPNRAGK